MKKTLWAVSICAGLLLAASAPAWAHHAFQAEFDQRKPVKLEGKVTDMEWINPHAWIHIDVKNPDGTVTNWMVECGSPNIMLRRGFTKRSLEVGSDYRGARLSGQERHVARQRQQCHLRGRQEAVRGRVQPGRSEQRQAAIGESHEPISCAAV